MRLACESTCGHHKYKHTRLYFLNLRMIGAHRPLKVTAQDCRVVVDVEARNAVTAMVLHLVSAFKMPAKPRPPAEPPRAAPHLADLPAKLRPTSGGDFGRRRAAMLSLAPSASLEAGGNLLRTLLQQQKVCCPPALVSSFGSITTICIL